MYWTDWEEDAKESKRGRIERAWMDGSNRNVFLSSKTVLWPNGLSLDIPQGILYWVDAYYDRIEMVYLNSSERKVSTGSPSPGLCRERAQQFTVGEAEEKSGRVCQAGRERMRNGVHSSGRLCVVQDIAVLSLRARALLVPLCWLKLMKSCFRWPVCWLYISLMFSPCETSNPEIGMLVCDLKLKTSKYLPTYSEYR